MNDLLAPLFNLLPAMWEKRWWGLAVAWVIALLGALGVLHYKERYRASATVYVDTQTMLRPLLDGLAVQPNVNQQVNMLARTMLSRANLQLIIDRNHLLQPGSSRFKRELFIQKLGDRIGFKAGGRGDIYYVSFVDTDPAKALGVVRTLLDLFVGQGVTQSAHDSAQALHFIDSQIAVYRGKLQQAQSRLQEFRAQHPDYVAHGASDFDMRQGQLQDRLTNLQGQLTAAVSSRDALQAQLAEVSPTLAPSLMPGSGQLPAEAQAGSLDGRIAVLQQRLDTLLQRYTDAYPDVISVRAELARLEAQRSKQEKAAPGARKETPQRYSQATNPIYQQLRISLAQSNANVAALQSQLGDVRVRLQSLQARERRMPGLDEKYAQLTRDYDMVNDNYQKLLQRRESAALSRSQDQSRSGDYFHIVDPPLLAPTPLFPHRTFLIALVLLVAGCLGVLTTYGLVMLFPTFRTSRQLREVIEYPVLGAVGMVLTGSSRARQRWGHVMFFGSSVVLVTLFAAWTVASMLHLIH